MTEEELRKDYYADRPSEPYSDDDRPSDWANIAHYAEENLENAFKRIAELEKENAELKKNNKSYEKIIDNSSATLMKEKLKNYKQITEAKEIIKNLLTLSIPIDYAKCPGPLQKIAEAEQFLKEVSE